MLSSKLRAVGFPIALCGLVSPQLVLAAQPDAGSLLRQQEIQQKQRIPLQLPVIEAEREEEEKTTQDGIQIQIVDLTIDGAPRIFSKEAIKALVADVIGQTLGLAGLRELATRITRHYRSRGYFLSRAYLPPQDATDGVITIVVQEVGLDPSEEGVEIISNTLRLREDVARRIVLEAVPTRSPMREADLERALLLLNQLPSMSSRVSLEPGSQPDTVRVLMGLDEGDRLGFNLGYDNAAGRYNGTNRLIAGVSLNNPTGIGDQLIISANSSNSDSTYAALSYSRPLGYRGLQLNAGYSHLEYALGKELKALNADGEFDNFRLGLSYPLKLTRLDSVWISGGLEHTTLVDRANGITTSDKTVQSLNLGFDWQRFHFNGLSRVVAELRGGELDIDPATNAFAADQGVNGPRKNGNYGLLRFNLSRLQRINDGLSLFASLDGQLADTNLDSSQQLQYGGPYGVRAYPTGEASDDEGAKLTLEGRYRLGRATALGDIQASLFFDKAWLRQYNDPGRLNDPTLDNNYQISGWGVGLTTTSPGGSQLSLTWARKLGNNPRANPVTGNDADGTNDKSRLWITASLYF